RAAAGGWPPDGWFVTGGSPVSSVTAGWSAAARGRAAALAGVARAGGAHLRSAGHAQRSVGGLAQLQFDELGRGVGLGGGTAGVRLRRRSRRFGRPLRDLRATGVDGAAQGVEVDTVGLSATVVVGLDLGRALVGGEDAELG